MTQTLTTERLREIASSPSFTANPLSHEVKYMARELLANREAQPVYQCKFFITDSRGNEAYEWQDVGKGFYNQYDQANRRILYTAPPAPAVVRLPTEFYSDEGMMVQLEKVMAVLAVVGVQYERKGDACRAAMLAQPVSQRYKLPEGFKLMPIEMTDEIGESIAMEAHCCGGIALCIYEAALAAAPEGGNDTDTRR